MRLKSSTSKSSRAAVRPLASAARQGHLATLDQERAGAQRREPVQHGRAVGGVDDPSLRLEATHRRDGVARPPKRRPPPGGPAPHPWWRVAGPGGACRPAPGSPAPVTVSPRWRPRRPGRPRAGVGVLPAVLPGGIGRADQTGPAGVRVQHELGALAVQELQGLVEGSQHDLRLAGHAHQQRAQLARGTASRDRSDSPMSAAEDDFVAVTPLSSHSGRSSGRASLRSLGLDLVGVDGRSHHEHVARDRCRRSPSGFGSECRIAA